LKSEIDSAFDRLMFLRSNEISVFEQEILDCPGCREQNQKFYRESPQKLRLVHFTTPRTPSFSRCRPRPATRKISTAWQFHQISIDEFTLLADVASFKFRLMTIGMAAIVSGCHPRFKWSATTFSRNANHFHGLYLNPARDYLNSKRVRFFEVALTSIYLPASVTFIGESCFYCCRSLTSITFDCASQLQEIHRDAFRRVPVEALILPGGIRHLSGSAIVGTRLETLSFSPLSMKFTVSESIVEDISVRSLIGYFGKGDRFRIESSIERICEGCFMWCKSVLSVVFEENSQLSRLEDRAFSGSGLTSIHLPASVTVISESCFYYCRSLVSITFESGSQLSQLANWAFCGSGLTSIHLPASVTVIGESCFFLCRSLASITFESGSQLSQLAKWAFRDSGLTSIHHPASVTVIGAYCFYCCRSLVSTTFESGSQLSRLEAGAFGWSGLILIHLPASVTVIGEFSFCDCRSLTSITFESGSEFSQLAKEAFRESGLTSIHVPASVTVIGEFCFCCCRSLTSITFESRSQLSQLAMWAFFWEWPDIDSSPRFSHCHRRVLLFQLRLTCVNHI
jgi:hypothetical protein